MKFDYSGYFNTDYFYFTLKLLRKARNKISLFFLADNLTEIPFPWYTKFEYHRIE